MFYNSNWFCYMTFLSAVRLLYTWIFQFLLEIGSWISWCYSFSGSFMKPVDNFLLWISFLDILWYVDIYLRWWTSMQLILNLMWNYDAQTRSHVFFMFYYCYYFCFYVWTKIAIMLHLFTCKQYFTVCTELLCIVCVVLYCNLFLQNINTAAELESLFLWILFSKA